MIKFKTTRHFYMAFLLLTTSFAQAATVVIPNTFVANSPAVAAQVNDNFNAVKTSVNDNDSNIATLMAAVAQLQTDLATANATIAAIQSNTVLELDGYLMLSTFHGYDTAEFTNINVQINSGSGNTNGVVNGLGNLTIGYNETSHLAPEFCSDPQYTGSVFCISSGQIWDSNVRRGSHNLILGFGNSYDDFGGIVAGQINIINGQYASVLGGYLNQASGHWSSVSGGNNNQATGWYSSISGGLSNQASGNYSSVSGGRTRNATGLYDWRAGSLFEEN